MTNPEVQLPEEHEPFDLAKFYEIHPEYRRLVAEVCAEEMILRGVIKGGSDEQ